MTMHWRSLGTEGRIEALRSAWTEGCSMRELAERVGTSKGGIAGFYSRHRNALADCPLRAPNLGNGKPVRWQRPSKPKRPRPDGPPPFVARPLMLLQRNQCKWPVNDAERGQEHLFCGMASEGPYCEQHKARSITDRAGWGYDISKRPRMSLKQLRDCR